MAVVQQGDRIATRRRSRTRKTSRRRRGGVPIRGLLPIVIGLAIWQLLGGSEPYLPAPNTWYQSVRELSSVGTLWPAIGSTVYSFALSLVLSLIVGVAVGYLVGRLRVMDLGLNPVLEFIRFTPAAALVPLAVLFVGYDQKMTVLVVVLGAVWPILLQTREGTRSIDAAVFDLADSLHMGPIDRFRKIVFPSILPDILLGLRLATPTVLVLVLLVELTTNVSGLGQLLSQAQTNFLSSEVYGLVVVAALLGVLATTLLAFVERYLLRYRPE